MRTILAPTLLLMLTAAACGGSDDDAPVSRPTSFGGARPVTLQVPVDFDETRTYPLVMILHGYGANGFVQQAYLKLGDVADARDMLVLAPDGTTDSTGKQFWNADPACCDFGGTNVDDVAYLGGMLDEIIAAWPVDETQVSVIGHSNGAFMADRMACARADIITSVAGLAGLGPSAACTPTHAVAMLHIHGDNDGTVPYTGGAFGAATSPSAVQAIAAWGTRNGCTGTAAVSGRKDIDESLAGDETVVAPIGGCAVDGAAELWTIEGGSHLPAVNAAFPGELMGWLAAHPRP